MRLALTVTAFCLISACTAAKFPEPTGPITTSIIKRDLFVKGVRGGGMSSEPSIVERTYELQCGPAPAGQSLANRQAQAVAILNETNGQVDIPLFNNMVRSGERSRANPTMISKINCAAIPTEQSVVTSERSDVIRYLVSNGLLGEL